MSKKSFFRSFFEEKELLEEIIIIKEDQVHAIEVKIILDFIEQSSEEIKVFVEKTLRTLDFQNGDIKHFLQFLAKCYINSFDNDEESESLKKMDITTLYPSELKINIFNLK